MNVFFYKFYINCGFEAKWKLDCPLLPTIVPKDFKSTMREDSQRGQKCDIGRHCKQEGDLSKGPEYCWACVPP